MGNEVTVDELVGELRARGLRSTTARRAVLEEVVAAGDRHLTTEELGRRVGAVHPEIHRSTVYRTLDALCGAGILSPAPFADRPATYHLTTDVHHHAVCERCGVTLQLDADDLEPLRRRLEREHGFRARPRHLTIEGRCASCSGDR